MIMQRFISISPLLKNLLELCLKQFRPICPELDSATFEEVDEKIFHGEKSFFAITDYLAAIKSNSEITSYICSLSPDDAFLLYISIQIAYLHFYASTQLFPAIPPEQFYQNLFAYLQAGYLSFKNHCNKHRLSIWEAIIYYERGDYDEYLSSRE